MDLPGIAKQALKSADIPFERLSGIQMNRTPHGGLCLIMLVFTGGTNPTAVLRVSTDPERSVALNVSSENLKTLRAALPARFVDSVPEPLWFEDNDGMAVFLESAQHGTPIKKRPPNRYFRSRAFKKDFPAVIDWLVAFNTALRTDHRDITPAQRRRLLNEPIAAYRERFEVSPALSQLLSETEETLNSSPLDFAAHHADFCTANVLIDRDHTVRVIDWEHELTPAWPLSDLLHFIGSLWCVRHGRDKAVQQRNYHALFFTQTHLTKTLQQGVQCYAKHWGLEPRVLLPLSAITWIRHALKKADYIQRFARSEEDASRMLVHDHHLTMIDHNQCLNLELLAQNRDQYIIDQI